MADGVTLDGRTAIVTGASQGLGRAEAIALAGAGARLVLNDLPGPAVHDTADEIIAAGGQAVVCAGDVGDWSTGEGLVASALASFGGRCRFRRSAHRVSSLVVRACAIRRAASFTALTILS